MKKTKKQWATTEDLKKVISHMENEDGLNLGARVEVYIEGEDDRYGITSMGHFSIVPNMTLTIEKIKDNKAK